MIKAEFYSNRLTADMTLSLQQQLNICLKVLLRTTFSVDSENLRLVRFKPLTAACVIYIGVWCLHVTCVC